MIPLIVAKLKEFERRKAANARIARRLLTHVWRRRSRKLNISIYLPISPLYLPISPYISQADPQAQGDAEEGGGAGAPHTVLPYCRVLTRRGVSGDG